MGTICVYGKYFDTLGLHPWLAPLLAFFRWLVRLFKPRPPGVPKTAAYFVRVRVLNGDVSVLQLPSPIPKLCWDVDTTPSGQSWCAGASRAPRTVRRVRR